MSEPSYLRHWKTILKILIVLLIFVIGNIVAYQIADAPQFQIRPSNEDQVHAAITMTAAVYTVLLAIPFVPGAEIGLALIAALGPAIAFLVYVCTLAGLTLSFAVGRFLPITGLIRAMDDVGLHRASGLLAEIEPLDPNHRLAYLAHYGPGRWLPALLRYRYLALAVLFNVPGNFLIGGGGGIALVAGASRLYSIPGFLVTVAIAVSPVPVAVTIFGSEILGR